MSEMALLAMHATRLLCESVRRHCQRTVWYATMLPTLLLDLNWWPIRARRSTVWARGSVPPLNLHQVAHAVLDQREKFGAKVLLHERSPVVIEGSCVCTAKEFAEWLFVYENEKPAGFLLAMQ